MKKRSIISILLVLAMVVMTFTACETANTSSTGSDITDNVTSTGKTTKQFAAKGSKKIANDTGKAVEPNSSEFLGKTTVKKVKTKDYTIAAKGSEYATGIKLPELTKKQATVTYMTNTTYDFIMSENSDINPTAIYHAMKIWKATYGVDIKIELVDWDNFTSHLVTSVAAGEGPDVMRFVNGRPKWIVNNLVAPLEDKMDLTDPDYDIDHMQEEFSMYGHLYAVSSLGKEMPGGSVVAYNKTKFKNAGVKDPMAMYKAGEWNWTNLIKTAKAMTNSAADEYGLASAAQIQPQNFGLMSLNSNGTVTLHTKDERFVKCMNILWKIFREDNSGRRTDEYRNSFPLGKDAMAFTTAATYCSMMDSAKENKTTDQFGVVPAPVNDIVGDKLPLGSKRSYEYGFAMSSVPKNQEGAIEFLRLVTKVGSNITRKQGKFGQAAKYFTEEEKSVFINAKYLTGVNKDCSGSIDGTNTPIYEYLRKPIIFNAKTTDSLSTILANAHSTLQAVIDEYEINAGLHS